MTQETDSSHKQILKSTGILGIAQIVTILIGIIRVKILAVLLGAIGVGIAGLYQSTIDLIKSATGFGLSYSAVRDIAVSAASNDEKKIAATVLVLRRWVWGTGLLGMLVTVVFCQQLSELAFGTKDYATGIAILSVGLLLSSIAGGYSALLQGLRRIGQMAKSNVLSALLSLVAAVVIYYFWGLKGIVPALLSSFVLGLVVNWYYSRKIKTVPIRLNAAEIFREGMTMASLGFFMSLTGLAGTATMYIVRSFVVKQGGLASVGYFVAAWSISSMYISAIFGAMGADYFPRLSAVEKDPAAVTKMVNEQTEIAMLVTAPIIIGMVSFIDIVVRIFYSKEFTPTAGILDWQLMGDFFKVVSWPIGFIILAKGKGTIFICTEFFFNAVYCLLVYLGWKKFGIEVTGIAFLTAYILLLLLVFLVSKKLVNFKFSGRVLKYIAIYLPLLVACFLSTRYIHSNYRYVVSGFLTLLATAYSVNHLNKVVGLSAFIKKKLSR